MEPAPVPAPMTSPVAGDVQRLEAELKKLRDDNERITQELLSVRRDLATLKEERPSAVNGTPEKSKARAQSVLNQNHPYEGLLTHQVSSTPVSVESPPAPEKPKSKSLVARVRYTVPFKAYSDNFNPTQNTVDTILGFAMQADRIVVIGFSAGSPSLKNDQMAIKRAMSVRRFLLSNGVPSTKISVGGGTTQISDNTTESGRNKNRRVEIDFLPKA
jgi:outer membrane protein OmpA-like peptidoglycan-associated protein